MNKVLIIFLAVITLASCTKELPKDYITVMGFISNSEVKNIDITRRSFDKRIKVNSDGTFSDTLKTTKEGYHTFNDGKNKILIHIKNGDVLNFEYDYTNFGKTVAFSGVGFETTAYLNKRKKLDAKESINNLKSFFKLEPKVFKSKVKRVEDKLSEILEPKGIDSLLKAKELSRNKKAIAYLKQNYAKEHGNLTRLAKGTVSPKFIDYENYNGGKTSLDDFKGNFVYIDVWATWCGPCKREIPHLKILDEKYKNKKIKFLSISLDNGRGYKNDVKKAKEAWKSMIKDRNMKGVQLYADKAWNSDFIKDYGIRSIPRFILIDDKGNIVNANAPRPSNKTLKPLLDSLLK